MNLFQLITVPLVLLFFVRSLLRLVRRSRRRVPALLEATVWLAAGVAIAMPDLTIYVARLFGIGRGADLVLYALAIAFLLSCLLFYDRLQRQRADITQIVRRLAIREAVGTGTSSPPDSGASKAQPPRSDGG